MTPRAPAHGESGTAIAPRQALTRSRLGAATQDRLALLWPVARLTIRMTARADRARRAKLVGAEHPRLARRRAGRRGRARLALVGARHALRAVADHVRAAARHERATRFPERRQPRARAEPRPRDRPLHPPEPLHVARV